MAFLHEHWKVEHILSWNQSLMDWQHLAADGSYNYLIAWQDDKMLGVLGYIPTSHFDADLGSEFVFLALWKVREDAGIAGLGITMLRHLEKLYPDAVVAVAGIQSSVLPLYRVLRYTVGQFRQHFVVRPGAEQTIATLPADFDPPVPRGAGAVFRRLSADEVLSCGVDVGERAQVLPSKSPRYFRDRFLLHPSYRYQVHSIEVDANVCGLIATRVASASGSAALRIVDFFGTDATFAHCGQAIGGLVEQTGTEYADLFSVGLSGEALRSAGFVEVIKDGPVIVPNHFEPFDGSKNGSIAFAFRTDRPVVLFRADGDQDRPNLVPRTA